MYAIRKSKGFTLIEILIVVIILGILAAIVIPQFSNASTSAKTSAVQSTTQSLRQQVSLYKLQHGDKLPDAANFWHLMTTATDSAGNDYPGAANDGPFGPYMQSTPTNSLNGSTTILNSTAVYAPPPATPVSAASTCGWVYDYGTLAAPGTGRLWGTDADSQKLVGP
jgi:general secretion pathway protein G